MATWSRNFMRKHQKVTFVQQSLWAEIGREISQFMAGLIILLVINLAPTNAQTKVVQFTDTKGVIHITSAGQAQGEKSKKSGSKQPQTGNDNSTQNMGSEPAAAMAPHPGGEPPSEPSPGTERNGPPPDLGALGQQGAAPQVSQSQEHGSSVSLALSKETISDSVP
jgi:hypothetical protein